MFVVNIKMDYKKILALCVALGIIIAGIVELGTVSSLAVTKSNLDYCLNKENFIYSLETINDNIDENVGKQIQLEGFVYTLDDLDKNFFVCGRYTEHENTTKVAGIICKKDDNISLVENEWIKVTGTITKGEYNGEIPVIKVEKIEKIVAPANTFV